MISRRSRWLFTAFFSLTALFTHAYRANAISGPMSMPVQACTYSTTTTTESPLAGQPVVDTNYYWKCPFISHGTYTDGGADWNAATVAHSFLDYTFPTSTANDAVSISACEASYSGSSVICTSANGDTTAGYHETLGPGFSALKNLGASNSWWDYYYVSIQAYNSGSWVFGNRTYNPPTIYGVGFN